MPTTIGTHSGYFHTDDVFAVASLTLLFDDCRIVRTRDQQLLDECDYVVDVGGEYDPARNRFDHHFKNGPAHYDGLLMSSFGLVWQKFGRHICGSKRIADKLNHSLVRPIDANDNGVCAYKRKENSYDIRRLSLPSVISHLNPIDVNDADEEFEEMVALARKIIRRYIAHAKRSIDSRQDVFKAVDEAIQIGRPYIEIEDNVKWNDHLFSHPDHDKILYVVYPHNDQWYASAVAKTWGTFELRKPFPDSWAGLRDQEFSRITGIDDGVFCHHGHFVCAAQTYQSVISLVRQALKN